MKITKRLAEQAYCYHEIEFESLEEYNEKYPEFIQSYIDMQKKIQKVKDDQPPFDSSRDAKDQIEITNI